MRRSPSIVPDAIDRDVYLVLDDFGRRGRSWREIDEVETDRATLMRSLLGGQYSAPVRVIAFNTVAGWSRDVSGEIADEIALRCARDNFDVPPFLEEFVERHRSGRVAQLLLPLLKAG
jgi:hypothetical protein